MSKIDAIVRKETLYISLWVVGGSLLTQGICLIAGWWSLPVLLGNLLGAVTAVGNFLLMGLTVQKALGQPKKQAADTIRLSQGGRLLLQGLVLVLAAVLGNVFNVYTTAIALLLPRVGVLFRSLFGKPDPVPVVTAAAVEQPEEDAFDEEDEA